MLEYNTRIVESTHHCSYRIDRPLPTFVSYIPEGEAKVFTTSSTLLLPSSGHFLSRSVAATYSWLSHGSNDYIYFPVTTLSKVVHVSCYIIHKSGIPPVHGRHGFGAFPARHDQSQLNLSLCSSTAFPNSPSRFPKNITHSPQQYIHHYSLMH